VRHKAKKIDENMTGNNPCTEAAESESAARMEEETTGDITAETPVSEPSKPDTEEELRQEKDKYLRLYAEFENYKKRVAKDKEELIKYGNESMLYELLPVIDNLEMALKHSTNDASSGGLVQGVEITLKEFLRVIDKFGLTPIEASDKEFDPSLHHAMTQVERDDIDENMVVEEFRKGYMFREKVLRPSLVAVSKKPVSGKNAEKENLEEES